MDVIVLTIATMVGLYMAANIGANDLANAMGTSVGSGAITLRQAVIISMIANTLGAVLAGGYVTNTISKGMIDPALLADEPSKLMLGMFAALISSGICVHLATFFGLPVSTTHAIVGAVVGFGIVSELDMHIKFKEKLGIDFRPYKILGACSPSHAYKAVSEEEHIGLMLPCNVVIQE